MDERSCSCSPDSLCVMVLEEILAKFSWLCYMVSRAQIFLAGLLKRLLSSYLIYGAIILSSKCTPD